MIGQNLKIIFFGTPFFAKIVLEILKEKGFIPNIIITQEDKPSGRKMLLTPPETKLWAIENNIKYLQPKKLRDENFLEELASFGLFDLGIVASYGKIIPQPILNLSKYGNLNVHPSLLPKLRGPSPIQSAILEENETGVSIMLVDDQMDHGPIVAEKKIGIDWPPYFEVLEKLLAEEGGRLLSEVMEDFVNGKIKPEEQEHDKATICKKIEKTDAFLDKKDSAEKNLRKIRAFSKWPKAYFFEKNAEGLEKRVIVKKARLQTRENSIDLVLEEIIREGEALKKVEIIYQSQKTTYQKTA